MSLRIVFILLLLVPSGFTLGQSNSSIGSNPSIGLDALFLYRNGSRGNDSNSAKPNGFSLQEAELEFAADVDPYTRAKILFAVSKENNQWKIEPEEAFVESLQVPAVTLKGGKFRAALGKYNTYHLHALPFIDVNLVNETLLGDEGLNDAGVSASYLIPTSWFSELTVQGINAGSAPFSNTSPNGLVGIARWRNLWDLANELTFDWGLSGAQGPNDNDKGTGIWGSDLTFKWRPTKGGKYAALTWSTEYLDGFKTLAPTGFDRTRGVSSFVQWQMAERWRAQARTEYAELFTNSDLNWEFKRKQSLLVGFALSEFSGFRLQYDHLEDRQAKPEDKISLQANFSIGAHPAHSY